MKEIVYPINLDDEKITAENPAALSLGWDLQLAVNVTEERPNERQVWAFDGSGNPLACLLKTHKDDPTPDAQLLAFAAPTAERCYPSYVDAHPDTYDCRRAS